MWLKSKMSAKEWQGLGKGWTPLILCMMWEAAKGNGSIWEGYLGMCVPIFASIFDPLGTETMPIRFDTPMFWPITDLKTTRDEYSRYYHSPCSPIYARLVATGPIPPLASRYPLHSGAISYHGQPNLSRSFHVEEDEEEKRNQKKEPQTEVQEGEVENEQEEEKTVEDVAMVPMADMLNARYGGENAKLFYEPHVLKMVTTKAIAAGDQIWNTYGDPPNSDLLRRYGYVDEPGKGLDIVEIQGSLVVECAASYLFLSSEQQKERVGWWLEMGGDDTFTLDMTTLIPPELLSFTQLLLLSDMEWEKTQEKEKPPKPKSDSVKKCVKNALERRMEMYSTTIEEDEHQLSIGQHTLNKRHALIIRIGEKKVLKAAIGSLSEPVPKKRKAEPENGARKKGARQK
ncbi:RuBisCO LSMT substrate-binding protein [Rhizoctonia solani]|uniref:RuBisCO LSMT substrate-binding protein n=1 Tax=Rhizoctonia solani TaxID=456999 RepID=A0A8H8SYW2_9AGAM|nr:RuBisCO LSMT substrate-binding protein [Rhizoctonia solani]QRW21763.1 RuBisCO LSMT substrate-binding protein [Rhizoctonia solani]